MPGVLHVGVEALTSGTLAAVRFMSGCARATQHPTPSSWRRSTWDDRYAAEHGPALLTGTQALVRLPLAQRRLDQRRGPAQAVA